MLAIFLDIETTGLDPKIHQPIDIAFKVIDPSTGEVKGDYQSIVKQSQERWDERDPISIEINGYTWEEVQSGKEPDVIAKEIIEQFTEFKVQRGKAVFICQ